MLSPMILSDTGFMGMYRPVGGSLWPSRAARRRGVIRPRTRWVADPSESVLGKFPSRGNFHTEEFRLLEAEGIDASS